MAGKSDEHNEGTRRLNVLLLESDFRELQALASESGRSLKDTVRYALGLVKIAITEERNQHKLMVVDSDGNFLKEIALPV